MVKENVFRIAREFDLSLYNETDLKNTFSISFFEEI